MMKRHSGVILAAFFVGGGTSYAAQPAGDRPEVLQKLFDCRGIAEVGARAACYDAQVDAFSAAERDRRVVVIDQSEVRQTRRRLFGFALPNIKLFSPAKGEKEEEFSRIETVLKGVARPNGALLLTLEDGARWVQSGSDTLATDPKPGDPIVIRKAAMGSYFANIAKRPAIRVRRIN